MASTVIRAPGRDPLPGVTAAFGIAEMVPDMSMSDFLAACDGALYRAKRAGRDRVSA